MRCIKDRNAITAKGYAFVDFAIEVCNALDIFEKVGFMVKYAVLFDRPTIQVGDNGLANWINMFVKKPFEGVNEDVKQEIIKETVEKLRHRLYKDDYWIVDYVSIRFRAVK